MSDVAARIVMNKRKICVVTGARAEYGLLYWLLREIEADDALELQLAVTGMHLSPEFGLTVRAIEADGFAISERIEMLLSSDTAVGIAKSIGLGVIGFADAFARLQPDVVVVLGDRFEILSAAQAALVAQVPIAHLHGGRPRRALSMRPSATVSQRWRSFTSWPPSPIGGESSSSARNPAGCGMLERQGWTMSAEPICSIGPHSSSP